MANEDIGALVVRIEANLKDFEKSINTMEEKTKGFGSVLTNALSFAGGLGIVKGVEKIVDGLKSGVQMGIEFDSTMQQNKIAFETMLGSAEKANTLLGELSTLAASTPFEFPELASSAKALAAFGVEASDIPKKLKEIGDISAGVGANVGELAEIYGKAKTQGRLFAEDINQLTGRGIPIIQELAKQFGVSDSEVKKLVEDGKIGFPQLEKAFTSLTSSGGKFSGMMEAQSKSFAGMMSTLKDNVQMTFGKILEPAFTYTNTTLLPKLLELTSAFSDTLQKTGSVSQAASEMIKSAFGSETSNTILTIASGIKNAFTWIVENGDTITTILSAIIGGFATYKGMLIATTIAQEVYNAAVVLSALSTGGLTAAQTALKAATGASTAAQWLLNAALTANPIGIIVVAIGALVGALIYLWNTNEGFRNFFINAWEAIKQNIGVILPIIASLILGPLGLILGYVTTHWTQVKDFTLSVWNGLLSFFTKTVPEGFQTFINFFASLPGNIQKFLQELFFDKIPYAIGYGIGAMIEGVKEGFPKFIQFFIDLPENIWNLLKLLMDKFIEFHLWVIKKAFEIGKSIFDNIINFIKELPNNIYNFFTDALNTLLSFVSTMGSAASNIGEGIYNSIINWVTSIPSKVLETFENILSGAKNFVGKIGNAFKGIGSKIQSGFEGGTSIGQNANGTNNWKGGPTWVGEKGPEIIDLPKGTRVTPNNKIDSALSGQTINYESMFNGATFNVRNDNDVKMIAREIYNLQQSRSRASGVVAAT